MAKLLFKLSLTITTKLPPSAPEEEILYTIIAAQVRFGPGGQYLGWVETMDHNLARPTKSVAALAHPIVEA